MIRDIDYIFLVAALFFGTTVKVIRQGQDQISRSYFQTTNGRHGALVFHSPARVAQ